MDRKAERRAPSNRELARKIPRILETGFFGLSAHLGERRQQRGIPDYQIVRAIEHGKIVDGPEWDADFENWKVTMQGHTVDGEVVTVILAVDLENEWLDLITAF